MKLLHVTMHYLPVQGGQEVYIASLNKLLNEAGITTDVMQPFSRHVKERPANVHMLPRLPYLHHVIHDINWFWFNAMLRFSKKKISEYDVVICHYAFHAEMLKTAKKLIILSHGVDWYRPPQTMADRYRARMSVQTAQSNTVIVANDTDYFRTIGCSAQPAEGFFKEIYPRRWFIPNCVDSGKYQADPDGAKEKIILVPRNIRWARGIHLAIEAFSHFLRKHPDYKLVIVGGPLSGKYYQHCLKLIKEFNLENNVVWVGSVSTDAIVKYYQKAMVTLIPTVALEGTSLSALESMAAKTPVVSTYVGGLSDLPTVQAEQLPDKIAEKLIYVLENYEKVRQEQYTRTREIFNMDNWQSAWLKAIKD